MADKSCHSCRRRRVKCDRALPACQKCALTGVECLGYGRLILWNKGIASRGKMMGKTYEMPVARQDQGESGSGSNWELSAKSSQTRICSSLVDPLFQDLGAREMRYIYHFDQTFCKETVIYDICNPVRELLVYLQEYPMLREVFVATSACHLYYLSPVEARSATVYRDALVAKHKALRLLNEAISDLSSVDIELVIVAILILMYLEFMDSGNDVWRTHLEGAKRLVNCLGRQTGTLALSSPANVLRRWIISETLVFDIMGSTISKSIPLTTSIYGVEDGFDVATMLITAETNNFASCPAQLLQCLLTLVQLSETSPLSGAQEDTVTGILETVQSFNPYEWALSVQSLSPCRDLDQRTWIASAYKAALCLYAPRLLASQDESGTVSAREERQHHVVTILEQISQLDPDSGLFKSTIWPSFIAGAEATLPEHRRWAWMHLAAVSKAMPYKTSTLAMDALVMIWKGVDVRAEGNEGRGWIEMTRSLGADLFVA